MNITISIDDNKIYGKSAINDYWANCKIDGESISIDMIKTTRKTDNAEKRRAEGDYLSILQTAYSIKIEGNRLIIYAASTIITAVILFFILPTAKKLLQIQLFYLPREITNLMVVSLYLMKFLLLLMQVQL